MFPPAAAGKAVCSGHVRLGVSEERNAMSEKLDDAKGRVKEAAGDLTGDEDLQREGKIDQATGTAKEKVGEAADKVKEAATDDDSSDKT
jgi:uncharacterized protein YjbJ (UPF0337 family)